MEPVVTRIDHSDPGALQVTLAGDLDGSCRDDIREVIHSFEGSTQPNVVLDLSAVPFADVTCLNALIPLRSIASDRGGSLLLVGLSDSVWLTLTMTGLARGCELRTEAPTPPRGLRARVLAWRGPHAAADNPQPARHSARLATDGR